MKQPQNGQISTKFAPTNHLHNVSDSDLHNEYCRRFTLHAGDTISSSEQAISHLRLFLLDDLHREKFLCIFLNGRNQVIDTECLFEGTLTTSAVYPREVLRRILHHGAAAILIAHNHPSGNPEPSRDDISITKKLKDACSTIDCTVHDHLIIAGDSFTSFADKGLI
ncbi:MAG: DNA repair protein RadC [Candidatus Marinimicrobia bacterium]|nr:DNA repair protein RadC [Candidatus Neomarinimicrobiota bacterium]